MDDATLAALRAALATTPGNAALRMVLVRAHGDRGDHAQAAALLAEVADGDLAPGDRADACRILLAAAQPARALALAEGEGAALLVWRARALLALGRREEAAAAYRAAVDESGAVEDPELAAVLGARVVERVAADGRPVRLAVVSNDDTDETEVRRVLRPPAGKVTFADVGGLEEVKEQIRRRIVLPFQKPSLFERFKKKVGGGILLYGPPGCGKTLLARATAGEVGATFYDVAISDVLDMYIGESERKLHALFDEARRHVPSVLFFDEIEALGGRREFTREATSSKLVSQFLSEMDGFAQNNHGVLVLGSTNVPWALDPAFRRPGRFDRVVFVPPPDRPARASILAILLAGRPAEGGLDLAAVAKATSTFSGADLAQVVETASDEAIQASLADGRDVPICQAHLRVALAQVKPTTLDWLSTARNYARYANEGGLYDDVLAFLDRHGRGA
jgi:ATP-dependent 26S proteasome regulatory subunit